MATPTALPAAFTVGQVLTSSDMNLLRGAMRVLQVKTETFATAVTSTSSSYVDTGLTVTITPTSSTSKVLVICNLTLFNNGASTSAALKLLRASTTVLNTTGYAFSSGGSQSADPTLIALDEPATTSATIYKLQFARESGAATVFAFPNNNKGQITVMEISA